MFGPLVETMVRGIIWDTDLAVHCYPERLDSNDRRSPFRQVAFAALRQSMDRHRCDRGLQVTRDTCALDDEELLVVPLRAFLLAY